jgi:hypothetical protein
MAWPKVGLLDEYDRNARLKPALLAILPASLLITAVGAGFSTAAGLLAGPLTAVGFTFVLAEIGRDWGKRKQADLFTLWGGMPTTVKLRHASKAINPHTLERYHGVAARLIGKPLPNPAEEETNPQAADLIYESVGDLLREQTRNKKSFPLVFKELVSYGFRRNLWGMKPFGISVALVCTALQVVIATDQVAGGHPLAPISVLCFFANVVLLCGWVFIVSPRWVRVCADAYAGQLLASCVALDSVAHPKNSTPRETKTSRTSKPKI